MITIKNNYEDAILIMHNVANWLKEESMPLWDPEDFLNGNILKENKKNEFYTAYVANEAVASFILKWEDPGIWPNSISDSGFIHKLCIRRENSGTGISTKIFEWTKTEIKKNNRKYLRLDCDTNRGKLRKFYEQNGFKFVDRKNWKNFDTALYEIDVSNI